MNRRDQLITIYYLEMLDRRQLIRVETREGFQVRLVSPANFSVNRDFYRDVGLPWLWVDKSQWKDARWREYAEREQLQTWIAKFYGQQVGYFELETQPNGNVEIAYFGLLPEQIGKGLGKLMLSQAVETAWSLPETSRVWVHTCERDHPHALRNYLDRGFRIYKTESESVKKDEKDQRDEGGGIEQKGRA